MWREAACGLFPAFFLSFFCCVMKQLDVVNFALAKLGKAPVDGLDDDEVGGVVRAMWPCAVEFVIEEVKPVWAKRVVRMEGVADVVLPGFTRSEVLPEGCVAVVDVHGAGWCVFNGRLFWSDEAFCVEVVFLVRPDDGLHVWSCADGELMGAKLACLCAFAITGRGDLEGKLAVEVKGLVGRAQYRARLQDMGRGGRDCGVSPWGKRGVI